MLDIFRFSKPKEWEEIISRYRAGFCLPSERMVELCDGFCNAEDGQKRQVGAGSYFVTFL